MTHALRLIGIGLAAAVTVGTTQADVVQVTATGEVEFNGIGASPLGDVNTGDAVTMTFLVESNTFVDSGSFPVRGYPIDTSSFSVTLGSVVMPLQNPFPAGETPYFVIRDNDPAVDGFYISTFVDFPNGLPLDQAGVFGQFTQNFSVTYGGGTLAGLDILGALGTYDFTGLTVFNFNVSDGPFKPLGIVFEQLTIASVSECYLVVGARGGQDVFDVGLHAWETQVGDIRQTFPVGLDDLPEFRIGAGEADWTARNPNAGVGAPPAHGPRLAGIFTAQVVMWNPEVFPGQPEQYTYGLVGWVRPDGTVVTRPYGNGTGMTLSAETFFNANGERVVRFPFTIPGFGD